MDGISDGDPGGPWFNRIEQGSGGYPVMNPIYMNAAVAWCARSDSMKQPPDKTCHTGPLLAPASLLAFHHRYHWGRGGGCGRHGEGTGMKESLGKSFENDRQHPRLRALLQNSAHTKQQQR